MPDNQKYNFLVALLRQVKGAAKDGDEVYEQWCELLGEQAPGPAAGEDRLDTHAQWLAALEARLEDLEQAVELIAGEEADSDDDGDDDEDLRGDEPRMGSDVGHTGRVPADLARASKRSVDRRSVDVDRNREYKLVGAKTVTRGTK